MLAGRGKQQILVPVWVLPLTLFAIVAAAAVIFLWIHVQRAAVVPVSQKQIARVSAAARQYGIPEAQPAASNKLTIIFYYEGYSSPEEAQHYVGLMQATLKTVEPFASADNLQTHTFTSATPKCHVEKTVKSLLKCDKSLINDINKFGYDHFKLVIVSPLNFVPNATEARGKNSVVYLSTYQGALTQDEINQFVSRFFMHELGHSLGLRDEYTRQRPSQAIGDEQAATALSGNIAYQPARPNCAPDEATAKQWWGAYLTAKIPDIGLFHGCAGRDTYVFPQKSTLMSDDPQIESYGRVSEDYLRGILDCYYGKEDRIKFPANTLVISGASAASCQAFRGRIPNFWSN